MKRVGKDTEADLAIHEAYWVGTLKQLLHPMGRIGTLQHFLHPMCGQAILRQWNDKQESSLSGAGWQNIASCQGFSSRFFGGFIGASSLRPQVMKLLVEV